MQLGWAWSWDQNGPSKIQIGPFSLLFFNVDKSYIKRKYLYLITSLFLISVLIITKHWNGRWSFLKGGETVRNPALSLPNGFHIQLFPKDKWRWSLEKQLLQIACLKHSTRSKSNVIRAKKALSHEVGYCVSFNFNLDACWFEVGMVVLRI